MADNHAENQSVAAGTISNSTINYGYSQEEYENGLREREAVLRREYAALLALSENRTDAQIEKRLIVEKEIALIRNTLANTEAQFQKIQEKLAASNEFINRFKNQPITDVEDFDSKIKQSLSLGDSAETFSLLTEAAEYEAKQSSDAKNRWERHSKKASYYHEIIGHSLMTEIKFIEASEHFITAAKLLPENDESSRVELTSMAAHVLQLQGEAFLDKNFLEQSIALQRTAISEATPSKSPLLLFALRWNLVGTLRRLGEYEIDAQSLVEAMDLIKLLLAEEPRHLGQVKVSSLHRELSVVQQELGKKSNTSHTIEDAVRSSRNALRETEHGSFDWALALGEHGASLLTIGERIAHNTGDLSYIQESIFCSRKAKRCFLRFGYPDGVLQANLNMALAYQRVAHDMKRVPEAVESIRLATEILNKHPPENGRGRKIISAQNTIGLAARTLASLCHKQIYFAESESALRKVLESSDPDKALQPWASANKNLALIIIDDCRHRFSNGENTTLIPRVYEAIRYHQNTLTVFTIENHPYQWAWQNFELAKAYGLLARLELSHTKIEEAKGFIAKIKSQITSAGWESREKNLNDVLAEIEENERYVSEHLP